MTSDAQKRKHGPHHHHHHHHHHQHKKDIQFRSLERITHLPVVESATLCYKRFKNSNFLVRWSLIPAETGIWLAVGTARPVVTLFKKQASAVDNFICCSIDVIENTCPIVTYPPDLAYNITKDYVATKVVTPMLKQADSVKQLGIIKANKCGEMAADRLNNVIDAADKYVEKYLPEITDVTDAPAEPQNEQPQAIVDQPDGKAAQTMQHVNQFGRKLQRRLTRRTLAEAKALKQQGVDTVRCLIYLIDLLAHNPKAFIEKMKEVWMELSKDEPENQVPPGNIEQLIAMLTREMARRVVHLVNYTTSQVTGAVQQGLQVAHGAAYYTVWWADFFLKIFHMQWAMNLSVRIVVKMHTLTVDIIEKIIQTIKDLNQEAITPPKVTVAAPSPPPKTPSPKPSPQATPQSPQSPSDSSVTGNSGISQEQSSRGPTPEALTESTATSPKPASHQGSPNGDARNHVPPQQQQTPPQQQQGTPQQQQGSPKQQQGSPQQQQAPPQQRS